MIRYDKPMSDDMHEKDMPVRSKTRYGKPKRELTMKEKRDSEKAYIDSLNYFDKLALYLNNQRAYYGPHYMINIRDKNTGFAVKALNTRIDGDMIRENLNRDGLYLEGYIHKREGFIRDIYDPITKNEIMREKFGAKYDFEEKNLDAYLVGLKMYPKKDIEDMIDAEVEYRGWDQPIPEE